MFLVMNNYRGMFFIYNSVLKYGTIYVCKIIVTNMFILLLLFVLL